MLFVAVVAEIKKKQVWSLVIIGKML